MTDKHNVVALADASPTRAIMHPLVEKMLGTNPTPEALEKILNLQREWEAGEAKRAYTAALTELKRDLPMFLLRDKTVDYPSAKGNVHYTHTSLAGAMEAVLPHLTSHGFSLTWRPGSNDKGGVVVTAILTHRQGHSEEATLTAPPDTSGNKSSAQAIASTITLLQRYSALAILGLATADMEEPTNDAPPSADKVDTARNMRALNDLVKAGKSRKSIEEFLGKQITEWTSQDLDKLRAWKVTPAPEQPPSEPAPDTDGPALLTKDQMSTLVNSMREWKLSLNQLMKLIENTSGMNPGSLQKVRKAQYAQLIIKFAKLKAGEITLDTNAMKFSEPPAEAE